MTARVIQRFESVDVVNPEVEVEVRVIGNKLWVNIDGYCRLRVTGIPDGILHIHLKDTKTERQEAI